MEFLNRVKVGDNSWYLYLIGILIVILGYGIIGQVPLLIATFYAMNKYKLGTDVLKQFEQTTDFSLLHISNNMGFLLMILIFIGAMIGLILALKIHRKKMLDITTSRFSFDTNRFLYGFGMWLALTIAVEIVAYFIDPSNYILTFDANKFFVLLIITIFLLPIQTAFEELFFRGYLNQGLYAWTKTPAVGIIVTSILFSLVHSANPEIDKFGFLPMQLYYVGAGLFLALIAYFDDGLEMSIGIHTATNLYGALFIKYEGSVLQTDTIWSMKNISVYFMVVAFYISAIFFIVLAAKRYGWNLDFRKIWKKEKEEGN